MKGNSTTCYGTLALLLGTLVIAKAEGNSAYSKKTSELELPEISVIIDTQIDFSDNDGNTTRDKLRIKEAELVFQGYLYPSVKGDFIAAFEQEYEDNTVATELDIEEAYLSFLELPLGLQATVGRRLLGFGRLNPVHPHHWAFTDTPLVMDKFFGHHPWIDDGVELSYLIPNPADVYLKLSVGAWNGKALGHTHSHTHEHDNETDVHKDEEDHEHEEEHEHAFGEELVEWKDHVFTARLFADLPVTDRFSAEVGGSIATDQGGRSSLSGIDLVMKYRWPNTFRRLKWHTECLHLKEDTRDIEPYGFFSSLQYDVDKYWQVGTRYDWSEFADNDEENVSASSGFLTYYLTHTTYIRGSYQYREHATGLDENICMFQFVWGIGPHSHRLED